MIPKKEFYFIRHGQTDSNISPIKSDHPDHLSINATGVSQAARIAPLIAALPIKTVCCSPLKRAQETKEIITADLSLNHIDIPDLSECNYQIWSQMTSLGPDARAHALEPIYGFMQQVLRGVNQALLHEGPVLIVAHGGVHWALCCHLDVSYDWTVDNCVPIHFSPDPKGQWRAQPVPKRSVDDMSELPR